MLLACSISVQKNILPTIRNCLYKAMEKLSYSVQYSRSYGIRVMNLLEAPPPPPPPPPKLVSFIGGIHIGARALHGLNLIWFGYIARLSQW
jgi:hypothetical protein